MEQGTRALRSVPVRPEPGANLPPGQRAAVCELIATLRDKPGALLPVLHGVQDALGYVPDEAIPLIAHELNRSRAEVHGVVSFYHYFRRHQPGRQVLQLCRAEACQAVGAVQLEVHAKRRLGVDFHGTSADGSVTLQPVYCLGNCACGPSLMIGGELHARVTPERFDELIEALRAEGPS
jgi:formate dehydrogenase subunit gamma